MITKDIEGLFNMEMIRVIEKIGDNLGSDRCKGNFRGRLSKELGLNYQHILSITNKLKKMNIVNEEKKGRIKELGLTKRGLEVYKIIKTLGEIR